MTRFGLDSTSEVPIAAHHGIGSTVAIRYLSRYTPKVVTRAEYEQYKANSISLYLVFEDAADNALRGYEQGKSDAEWAVKQALDILGPAPSTWELPFAVDFDPSGREAETDLYFEGTGAVMGKEKAGPYGSYSMCAHAYARGFRALYQTYAWSSGLFYDKAKVYQYSNDHTVGGVGTDFDRIFPALDGNFGQYNFVPLPPPNPMHYERYDKTSRHLGGREIREDLTVIKYDALRRHPLRHRAELAALRTDCKLLAGRIWTVAHEQGQGVWGLPPSWAVFHRGWRFQQLIHRYQGKKLTA